MDALKKWSEGRSKLLAVFGPQLAAAAHDMNQGFKHVKQRRIGSYQFPLPPLNDWFQFYRSHRKPFYFFRILFAEFSAFGETTLEFADLALKELKSYRDNPDELNSINFSQEEIDEAKNILDNILEESFKDIEADLDQGSVNPDTKSAFLNLLSQLPLEASFFFLISTPCWLLYRESPTLLYRRARLGNVDALEKLLRLDALMIHDPFIGKQIQSFRFKNKTSIYSNLLDAIQKKPKAKITRKKVKYALAGFLSALSVLVNQPLTEPEIRALFDAAAQDYKRGNIDTDLPDSPQSFYMAIKREREYWLQSLPLQKKVNSL